MLFVYEVKEFLLNAFFIMFPLIFYQFLLNEKIKKRPILKNLLNYLLFSIPIILCMVFPIVKQDAMIFDLRLIPLILACFYSSFFTSLLVCFTLIISRFMINIDTGAYLSIISTTISFLIIFLIIKRYHLISSIKKIVVSSLICFISHTMGLVLMFNPYYTLTSAIKFYAIQSVFMGLAIYIIESIRKNVQIREELILSEQMKVASVVSASVAHEIRNPLTTVRGFIQLLSQKEELSFDKKKMYGEICLGELDRAQQIISDYLSLAKPYPEREEKIDIGEEIEYASKVLTSFANLKGVNIEIKYEANLLIIGDRQKLRQCIINISKNGIEAMEDQSGVIKLEGIRKDSEVILSICDTGVGMTPDQINRLGMPYFSTKEKGTGLGTMVSYSIIKNMNGKIGVKSELGKGTIFHISFPLALQVYDN